MVKKNVDIRNEIKNHGLSQWMVAEKMEVSEATFTRWLRAELSQTKKDAVIGAIEDLKRELQEENEA